MHRVVTVEPLVGYKVKIRFSDGVEGEVDLSYLVGKGVFTAWDDPAQFARVSVNNQTHTLTWPGGIDICPDALYQDVITKK